MKVSRRYWVTMTWEKTKVQFVSREPLGPALLRERFREKDWFSIDGCAYDAQEKTGRLFLLGEADDDDEDEGVWSREDVMMSEAPVMTNAYTGSLETTRVRYQGE